ncbi:MAG: hypothetical protein WC783_00100 [Candidatus Paceibacterota bacterium]|jgi:hypothetical protein
MDKDRVNAADTILIFTDSRLLRLWKEELIGQLSDGYWENRDAANWLWQNTYAFLGNKNEVYYKGSTPIEQKDFDFKNLYIDEGIFSEANLEAMAKEYGFKNTDDLISALVIVSNTILMVKEYHND